MLKCLIFKSPTWRGALGQVNNISVHFKNNMSPKIIEIKLVDI